MMTRRIRYILLFLLLTTAIHAQRGYEFWLDDDYDGRIAGMQSTDNDFALSVDVGTLSPGLHIFNYHAQDVTGSWGTLHRQAFLIDATGSSYEYWIDEDYSHRGTGGLSGPEVSASVDISHLSPGIHVFNYRTLATGGSGALTRHAFLIGTDVSGYEYWYDDNYAKRKVKAGNGGSVALSFDLNEVPAGIHALNIRPRTSDGTVGPATSMLFVNELAVVAYEYWFDDDIANKVTTKASGNDLQLPISVSHLSGDVHYLNFRAMHADGSWGTLMRKGFVLKSNIIGYDYAFGSDSTKHVNVTSSEQLVMQSQKFAIPDPKERTAICDTTTIQIDTVANTAMAIRRDTTDFSMFFRNDEGRVSEVQNSEVAVADTLLRQLPEIPLFGSISVDRVDSSDFRGFYINVPDSDTYVLATTQECRLFFYDDQGKRIDDMPLLINPLKLKAGRYYGIIYHMKGTDDSFAVSYAIENNMVAKPIITHKDNRIAISTTTAKATIHYTMDGTTPDATSTVYTDTITVSRNCIIKAVAVRENYEDSDVDSLIVDWFKVANVEFDQNGHTITLTTQTDSATIHYTLSNSGAGEQIYSAPLTLSADCTIEVYATRDGYTPSDTTSFVFHADGVTCSNPVFAQNENVITISTQTENAQIYYTTDGTEPTNQSQLYADSIVVDRNMTIKAIAMRENYYPSQVTTFEVNWFKVAIPTLVWNADTLIVSSATEGATIDVIKRFTSDGDVAEWAGGVTPMRVELENLYYEIWARKEGWTNSDTLKFYYPYTAWHELLAAVEHARQTIEAANQSDKVVKVGDCPYAALNAKLTDAENWYAERNSEAADINDLRNQILQLIAEVEAELNAVDYVYDADNGVLAINGGTTLAEALDAAGGRDEVAKTITAIVWNSTATLTNSDLQGLDNPNMLVYVQSASQAPSNCDNVVIGNDSTGYMAKNIKLKDVAEGNGDFYCPIAFTAEMISYTHEYRQQTEVGVSRGWETIAMPFTVQTIMHETKGLITPFGTDSINKHFWLRQLTQQGLAQARRIEANTPYLISMPNSDAYSAEFNLNDLVTFSSQNVEVPVTQLNGMEAQTATGDMVMLQPNFKGQSATAMIYALNVGVQRDDHPEGSVFVANYRSVRPFEAFTVHHGNGPAPQFISISDINGGTTGIEDVRCKMSDGRGDNWYDLNGRKLQQKPTQKGVYILNGHKTVIR